MTPICLFEYYVDDIHYNVDKGYCRIWTQTRMQQAMGCSDGSGTCGDGHAWSYTVGQNAPANEDVSTCTSGGGGDSAGSGIFLTVSKNCILLFH